VLYKVVPKRWSDKDKKFLVDNWSTKTTEEIAKTLDRGIKGIETQARSLGLYRSRRKQAEYFPEISESAKSDLEELLPLIKKNTVRLDNWLNKLEEVLDNSGKMSAKDILALAKAVESFSKSSSTLQELAGLIEKANINVENMHVNMNVYSLMQVANEVMAPDQRVEFAGKLKDRGVVYEATV